MGAIPGTGPGTGRVSTLRRLPFFAKKLWRDVFAPLRYPLTREDVHGARLGQYYLVFDEAALRGGGTHDFRFDADGIPAVPTYIDVERPRLHYFPIAIGQYALAIFHSWLARGQGEDEARFLKFADWFADHQAGDGCWYAHTDVPIYGLKGPWASAMAQGRGLSVLTRAWQRTGARRYLEGALRALPVFETKITDGGVVDGFGGVITYEEFPVRPAPHVLNGMIFGLFGLWDLARARPDDAHVRALFEQGAASLETLLPHHDTGFWSLYDLYHLEVPGLSNPATAHYHDMHVRQLEALAAITGRPVFSSFARRWAGYQGSLRGRTWAYRQKAAFIARRRLR